MSRGINLEEFRSQLDTDAQRRCRTQEEAIKKLQGQIKDLQELVKDKEHIIENLQKKCFVQSFGALCLFCNFRTICTARTKEKG